MTDSELHRQRRDTSISAISGASICSAHPPRSRSHDRPLFAHPIITLIFLTDERLHESLGFHLYCHSRSVTPNARQSAQTHWLWQIELSSPNQIEPPWQIGHPLQGVINNLLKAARALIILVSKEGSVENVSPTGRL